MNDRPSRRPPAALLAALTVLVTWGAWMPGAARGSSIQVLGAAARTGAYGARLTLAGCTAPEDLILVGSVTTDQTACRTITASADVSGAVTFTAGDLVSLESGFSVASGSTFRILVDPGIQGDAYLQDDTPGAETTYVARFSIEPEGLNLSGADEFEHFVAYDHLGTVQLRLIVTHDEPLAEDRLVAEVRLHDGTFESTADLLELVLLPEWNTVEVDWQAASSGGTDDGLLAVCVNDDGSRVSCQTLSHDHAGRVDSIRWGARGVDASTTGFVDLDDFVSGRDLPAGL